MLTQNISTLKIHKLTNAQYERELAADNIDEYALYLTPDESSKDIVAGENVTITKTDSQIIINAESGFSADTEVNGGTW